MKKKNRINEKFVKLHDGSVIQNYDAIVPEEARLNKMSAVEKVQYYMIKISKEMYKFIGDICKDLGVADVMSVRIQGDGTLYTIEVCNGITKVIIGRQWPYETFLNLAAQKQLEVEMNTFVRKAYALTEEKIPREETYWI